MNKKGPNQNDKKRERELSLLPFPLHLPLGSAEIAVDDYISVIELFWQKLAPVAANSGTHCGEKWVYLLQQLVNWNGRTFEVVSTAKLETTW